MGCHKLHWLSNWLKHTMSVNTHAVLLTGRAMMPVLGGAARLPKNWMRPPSGVQSDCTSLVATSSTGLLALAFIPTAPMLWASTLSAYSHSENTLWALLAFAAKTLARKRWQSGATTYRCSSSPALRKCLIAPQSLCPVSLN